MNATVQIVRLVLILALLCVAAAIATPKGRLPLALRGMAKLMARDRGRSTAVDCDRARSVSSSKRAVAFTLIILALLLALV